MSARAPLAGFSAVKLALMAQEARAHTSQILRADPIAIVGMACRTPGGCETPDAFWRLLAAGVDATSDIPADRFDAALWHDPDAAAAGKMQATRGGFLAQISSFDADYFGILPREAEQMDPQQRIALETAIEAIDDAGAVPSSLRGARAGVFMACYHSDYARLIFNAPEAFDTRTLTGGLHGVVANRISYFLDWRGPSLTLDTGCSSSLVAVHLACQSLRWGESDFALAGGVSIMIAPELFVAMTKVGFMAQDGRCKAFDARADGFGRGEGCGVVALKRLGDAIANGDRIHAVIRGSAVNQDGRSTVLTAPNGQAQKAMILQALEAGAIEPERIAFVEAHGTGTALGDPIEIEAIADTLGHAPLANPCFVGSAKANIGHLEAAAGVVGLIKAAQVLRHKAAPPQPGFGMLSPHISLEGTRLQIPTALTPLADTGMPQCAAVSSFGIGGTNAHVVLEEASEPAASGAPEGAVWILPLSAKSREGAAALARTWLELLGDPSSAPIEDLCTTAAQRRAHYPVRIAVAAKDKAGLRGRLSAAAVNADIAIEQRPPRVGFVFSGQGPQWWAMARELQQTEPAFQAAMQACDAAIRPFAGWSVIDELAKSEDQSRIAETAVAQPALFSVQTSLVALWASWNILPAAVTGHSVGEIAALHAAGVLPLSEAARIVVNRGRIMQAATGQGRMAVVSLSQAEAQGVAARYRGLDVAAVNGPRSTVLSGARDALEAALAELQAQGVEARDLQLDYAFHSAQMAELEQHLARALADVAGERAAIPVFSTLTGAALAGHEVDATYLARAIRAPVRFADAVAAMAADGVDAFVEIGPHPVLASAIAETLQDHPPRAIVASLRRGREERATMRSSLAALYCAGADPDWEAVQPGEGRVTSLPLYPWRRRRFWVPSESSPAPTSWLGAPVKVAGTDKFVAPVHAHAIRNWVEDHRIFDRTVVPATAIMQVLVSAGTAMVGAPVAIEDFVIHAPLAFNGGNDPWQIVGTTDGQNLVLGFYAEVEHEWRRIAEARTEATGQQRAPMMLDGGDPIDVSALFERLADLGIALGSNFRTLTSASCTGDQGEGRASLAPHLPADPSPHPALLDAGLQLAMVTFGNGGAFLPIAADRVTLDSAPHRSVRVRASITSRSETAFAADIFAQTEDGRLVATFEGVRFVKAEANRFVPRADTQDLYAIEWTLAAGTASPSLETEWIVLEDEGGIGRTFAASIEAAGGRALRLAPGAPTHLPAEMAHAALACFWLLDEAEDGAGYEAMLALVRAYGNAGPRSFVLVVSGTSGEPSRLGKPGRQRAAGIAALARVAALEHPDLRLRVVDLDPLATPEQQVTTLRNALCASSEPVLSVRGDEVRGPRLRRVVRPQARPVRVVQSSQGLDGVALQAFSPPPPGPGELQVQVRAAGVNFRDTLVALGAYPGLPVAFGAECAGIVASIGPGVAGFAPGDRVVGLAGASMATHALLRADLAYRLPDGVRFDLAAALPVAAVTAHIGLRHFAGLKAGDRVLIHAATGGVGLAALALARRMGAEVFATAGSDEKRAFLHRMGVEHVFSSRTTDFAKAILAATGGEGVRVALNSLTGRFVGATLNALARDGMLLELGKREIWTPQEVAAARPDVCYRMFDAGELAQATPALFQFAMQDVLDALNRGEVPFPPVATHALKDAPAVLRRVANARHIGKLVLTVDALSDVVVPVQPDADYLVTGGLGGVGLHAAAWLVSRGARRITLVGRGAPSAKAHAAIAELERAGVTVRTERFDVSDVARLRALMREIGTSLRGVFHAAGIPADGLVLSLDAEAIAAARHGKVEGARALRRETRGTPLDFVVLCSSAAGLFGAQGQGAYAAANAELEALAQEWRSDGVNVASVAWGPWAESGMFVGAAQGVQSAWRARGLVPMSSTRALAGLDRLLANGDGHAVIADIDWDLLSKQDTGQVLFTEMMAFSPHAPVAPAPTPDLDLGALRKLPPGLRRSELDAIVARCVRAILELPEDGVLSAATPLKEAGLDSLLAVELRNQLARLGGTPLPVTLAFDHPTLAALADRLAIAWNLETAASAAPGPAVDDMSDAEAEALLVAELTTLSAVRPT